MLASESPWMCSFFSSGRRPASLRVSRVSRSPAVCEKLFHPRLGGPVRSAAGRRGGHSAASGRRSEGSHAAEAVTGAAGSGRGALSHGFFIVQFEEDRCEPPPHCAGRWRIECIPDVGDGPTAGLWVYGHFLYF